MTVASLSITNSVQQALDRVFNFLPNLIGFLVILVVGYFIAKAIRKILDRVLLKLRIDQRLTESQFGDQVEKISPGGRPSKVVGGIVFWFIMLFILTAAVGALKIPSVTGFMNQVLDYLPNVVAAVLIFVIAAAISGAVAAAVTKLMGDTPTGKLAATIVPGVIMAIALFMVLTQLKIATAIVTITYAAVLGMLALTGALAFGLGGRDVAARIWTQAYDKSQEAKEQAQADLSLAKERGEEELDRRTGTPTGDETVEDAPPPARARRSRGTGRTSAGKSPIVPPRE